ncbi:MULTISPECIES: hypothetical protein [Anoxybacillus]|uniref:Uncharacterized protein n=1 Tax=Anoxybacillus ayderensis TaxID=265546 RepID=A0A0D0HN12_9BACL|nr:MULTISPECIES: hypothetical protein [Anoxybacillus]KIP20617.1 hypothetical protein JV16_02198 [Anoxybacillus ayderensis]MED0658310.1 hypothetical protein [Anoxybacillus ayderensis]
MWREEEKEMEAALKKNSYRGLSLKSKKNVIKPKVKDGKLLLDRKNPLHRYIFNDGEN